MLMQCRGCLWAHQRESTMDHWPVRAQSQRAAAGHPTFDPVACACARPDPDQQAIVARVDQSLPMITGPDGSSATSHCRAQKTRRAKNEIEIRNPVSRGAHQPGHLHQIRMYLHHPATIAHLSVHPAVRAGITMTIYPSQMAP